MPIREYYGGKGEQVMREMKKRYGAEKGERVFYATANKRGLNPSKRKKTASRMGGMAVGLK
jgi:hypothetical protein